MPFRLSRNEVENCYVCIDRIKCRLHGTQAKKTLLEKLSVLAGKKRHKEWKTGDKGGIK